MFKTCVNRWLVYLPALAAVLTLSSCFSGKKAQKELNYLQGNLDTLPNLKVPATALTIQKGDLLGITLYSDDANATAAVMAQPVTINAPIQGISGSNTNSQSAGVANGYLVNEDGYIQLYKLGFIKVAGMTKQQLADTLAHRYVAMDLLKNPYVEIRFLNFKFTVIGEVTHPGTFSVPDEKVTVLQMLGLAGDLTMYGRRDNVLVIREVNGKREFGRLDLHRPDLFQSPYYYLKQNDVILVEASSKKASLSDQTTLRNLSIVTGFASLVSVAAIIINLFK